MADMASGGCFCFPTVADSERPGHDCPGFTESPEGLGV